MTAQVQQTGHIVECLITLYRVRVWHMLVKCLTVFPAMHTHTFVHGWNELSCLYSLAAGHHCTLAGTHFPAWVGKEAE